MKFHLALIVSGGRNKHAFNNKNFVKIVSEWLLSSSDDSARMTVNTVAKKGDHALVIHGSVCSKEAIKDLAERLHRAAERIVLNCFHDVTHWSVCTSPAPGENGDPTDQAACEGWGLFSVDDDELTIMTLDSAERFQSDVGAFVHVATLAAAGSKYHQEVMSRVLPENAARLIENDIGSAGLLGQLSTLTASKRAKR